MILIERAADHAKDLCGVRTLLQPSPVRFSAGHLWSRSLQAKEEAAVADGEASKRQRLSG